ncbi:MAG TPA: zinc-binding alcohol dehydrogenase [Candidatus Limnocylindria bacterium]|nr:zinc-binding alcohol dehydrogenase [Candidatus Limnocylindria bacterium]
MTVAAAVWFPRARAVELRTEELAATGPGDVRVHASLSAISHGTEMLVYRGLVDRDLALDLPTVAGGFGFPLKYGYASVGQVAAAGRDVRGLREGDLVFALHPHQDEYVLPASLVRRLPDGVAPEQGVFLANLETAINVVLDAKPRLGETVAVLGQGVVGLLVTQLLRRSGARVVAIEPSALRRSLAAQCGAEHALAAADAAVVRRLSGGRGADIAIEASGDPGALQDAIDWVAPEGTVVVCSWYGEKAVPLDLGGSFHRGRVRLISSQVGRIDPALAPRWDRDRRLALATELLGELTLASLITHRFAFARAADAYALLDDRSAETVQVVLDYA